MNEQKAAEELRDYPILRELLTDQEKYQALRDQCLRTCKQLDELVRTGSPQVRETAQTTLNAYGHALGFLDEALQARDEVLEQEGELR